jgi:ATP-binding cassette subfamily C protein CydD
MKPLDPRLVREARATAGYLILVVALATFATLATVGIAFSFSSFVVEIFVNHNSLESQLHWLGYALIAAAIRAIVHYAQEWAGFFAAGKVKNELRAKALKRIEKGGSELVSRYGTGELSSLLGSGLDAIDVYFAKYLPQLVFTALVTPALTALIWFFDPASGLTVLFTLPLIPLFMVMIGIATRDLQDKQLDSLQKLNGHFLEIIKGLTTLKIFNRVELQEKVLLEVSEQYRSRTMKVLRLSFLSGFALELAASLSVALLAVSIGIRLVDGQMFLFTGLFILIIAPEVYLPLRNVGAQFHAAAGGVAVSSKVLDLIQEPHAAGGYEPMDIQDGLTVLAGPSGVGKSLRLKAMVSSQSTWMPQTSTLLPGSIRDNIVGQTNFSDTYLDQAVSFAQIGDLELNQLVTEGSLSGGQRQRIALARAIYRLQQTGSNLLLLDEPTSQVDSATSERIVAELKALCASGVKVVAATHSQQLIEAADQVVKIDG